MHPDQVKLIADRLRVAEKVVAMNRRLAGDASLNTPIRDESESGEWQDWLVDEMPSQKRVLLESEELDNRRRVLGVFVATGSMLAFLTAGTATAAASSRFSRKN